MTVLSFPQSEERSRRLAVRRRSYGELPFTPRWAEAPEESVVRPSAPSPSPLDRILAKDQGAS